MEFAKYLAKTLETQQTSLTQQMILTAKQFKKAAKEVKPEDKDEFFQLTRK